jgi:glycosyltransferase involved in cell wall biosynthesis
VRKAIRSSRPDVVIAFLQTPSILAALASLPRRDYALIVSERSLDLPVRMSVTRRLSLYLHHLTDAVVCNSYAQEAVIREICLALASRVMTIPNCVDLERYRPKVAEDGHKSDLRILCIGRFAAPKNYLGLLKAVEIVSCHHPEINLTVDAYGDSFLVDGKPGPLSGEFLKLQDALRHSPVRERFRLHDPIEDVVTLYQEADALCLTSLWEGCSNVICEAMACGRPVLASHVSDNPVLVEDGVNGFLFDPTDPADIANAIVQFSQLPREERIAMGKAGRQRAEYMLAPERFVGQYEELIEAIKCGGTLPHRSEAEQYCGSH